MNPVVLQSEPAVAHLLSILRDERTSPAEFAERTDILAGLVIAEALSEAPSESIEIATPLESVRVRRIIEDKVIAVPILRAGLGMERAFLRLLPGAAVYHIGLRRDEKTFAPHYYYDSFPRELTGKTAYVLDPMLATGGSAVATVRRLVELRPRNIVYCGIIGAPDGVSRLSLEFPQVRIFLAALDSHLDDNAYIRPGLGDAGDRYFGTL